MTYGPPSDGADFLVRPVVTDLPRSLRPRTPAPARGEVWRVVLVVLGCLVGPPASVYVGFLGAITYSGCFFSCGQAQPVLGALLLAAALALLLAGPLLAALLIRRASAVAWSVVGILGGGLLLVMLIGGL